jgi:hypothetical protein
LGCCPGNRVRKPSPSGRGAHRGTAEDLEVAAAAKSRLRRLRGLVKRGQEFIRWENRCAGPSAGVRWACTVEAAGPDCVYLGQISLHNKSPLHKPGKIG